MKSYLTILIITLLLTSSGSGLAQDQEQKIDSLIQLFKKSRHNWNTYARQFIEIGEPAIPALVEMLEDKSLEQWPRRIAAMTLNDMHSPIYTETALKIFLDRNEDQLLRNSVINGMRGHDLSFAIPDIWKVYTEEPDEWWFRSNIAGILSAHDTALAYHAYNEIYHANDGHLMRSALLNIVQLRPSESTSWFLKGLQTGDWMTANVTMDSLVTSEHINPEQLISLYEQPETTEEVRWRITYIFGNRDLQESLPLLVDALQEPSWLISNEAAVGLSRMEGEEVTQKIGELIKSDDPRVVKDAKWVIVKIKDKR